MILSAIIARSFHVRADLMSSLSVKHLGRELEGNLLAVLADGPL
jgi:hypothetical protein